MNDGRMKPGLHLFCSNYLHPSTLPFGSKNRIMPNCKISVFIFFRFTSHIYIRPLIKMKINGKTIETETAQSKGFSNLQQTQNGDIATFEEKTVQ